MSPLKASFRPELYVDSMVNYLDMDLEEWFEKIVEPVSVLRYIEAAIAPRGKFLIAGGAGTVLLSSFEHGPRPRAGTTLSDYRPPTCFVNLMP